MKELKQIGVLIIKITINSIKKKYYQFLLWLTQTQNAKSQNRAVEYQNRLPHTQSKDEIEDYWEF